MRPSLLLLLLSFTCFTRVGAQVVINEICSANGDINYDPQFFNFSDWVELYNPTNQGIDLTGYYLTDDATQPTRWKIPSNSVIKGMGYMLIWCDGINTVLHSNFSLNSDGESIILFTALGIQRDKIDFPKTYTNTSYGRTVDGGPEIKFLLTPSPGSKNNSSSGAQQLLRPTCSVKAGRSSGPQVVTLSHTETDVQIRYTLDGSEPGYQSLQYDQPIIIAETSILKAKAFKAGYIPSNTEANTYFVNEHEFSLPVVSITTDPRYLWNDTIGIYTDGTNGIAAYCQTSPFNWNQKWYRHGQIEFFKKNGTKEFDQSVDIRIGGTCTRANPQKSLVVKARSKYGKNTIDEKLFSAKESSSYGGFMLRSGGDFWGTMFLDALLQTLPTTQMDIDYTAYDPKIVYLNGHYWGIQNLREKVDADYFKSNYGVDHDDLDLGEWTSALEGSLTDYINYLNTLQTIDLSKPEAFEYIDKTIDVQEYINYMTSEIYYANTDWPGNNVKFWRQRSTSGKWRWVLWDLDFGFSMDNATHPTLQFATEPNGPSWPNPPWSTLHFRLLLQNPQFRNQFIQTLTTSLFTTFEPSRVKEVITSFQNNLKTEMPNHLARWGFTLDVWNSAVQSLADFAMQRNNFIKSHVAQFFGLADRVNLSVSLSPDSGGKISINGIASDQSVSCEYFKGIPFSIKAFPYHEYSFKHWNITKHELEPIPLISRGAGWKYDDHGHEPYALWSSNQFDDSEWNEGPAKLGYGTGSENTPVGYGQDEQNKFVTTWFRKWLDVADTTNLQSLVGQILYNDGAVVYLNGHEVFRSNMPSCIISDTTLASSTELENVYVPFYIPKGTLKAGLNLIAVEVHQENRSSVDMIFDLELRTSKRGKVTTMISNEIVYSDTANTDVTVVPVFEPTAEVDGLVINEFSATGSGMKDEAGDIEDWIELYNKSDRTIDLGGLYITDNLNNKLKYQIRPVTNNETVIGPGGYAILWADEELTEGPLHVNFKLSANGESIGLYQKVGGELMVVDEVTFTKQSEIFSSSRIPNGTGPFSNTTRPSPMQPNGVWTEVKPASATGISLYPNPTSTKLIVRCAQLVEKISIDNSQGIRVKNYAEVSDGDSISLEGLPEGLYVVVLQTADEVIIRRIVIGF